MLDEVDFRPLNGISDAVDGVREDQVFTTPFIREAAAGLHREAAYLSELRIRQCLRVFCSGRVDERRRSE